MSDIRSSIIEGLMILGWSPEKARARADQAMDDADRAYERSFWSDHP